MKINHIINASKQVLSRRNYLILFIALIFIILAVFISIPVFLIPANSLLFQLTVLTIKDYILLTILSVLTSLLIVMKFFPINGQSFVLQEEQQLAEVQQL